MHVFGVRSLEFSWTYKQYLKVDNFPNFTLPFKQCRKLYCITHKYETIILPYKGMDSKKDFSKPPALKKG